MSKGFFTSEQLLHGALYAIQHAGSLLYDAVLLYRGGRNSSAVALAVFCREELGRAGILLAIRRDAKSAGPSPISLIRDKCEDHLRKLSEGQLIVTARPSPDQGRRLIELRQRADPAEYRKLRALLSEAAKQKAKRGPAAINQRRIRALYVDPTDDGDWSRPNQETATEAAELLHEVASDYMMALDGLVYDDPDLKTEIDAWSDRPELPDPITPD